MAPIAWIGFLAQLRNEASTWGTDRSSLWSTALSFVTDVLHHASASASVQADRIETRLLRLSTMYSQLAPNSLGHILHVILGVERVQPWGGAVREIKAGDTVWIPPGEKHWHGAAP